MNFMPSILRDNARVSTADDAPHRPSPSSCPYPKRVVCDPAYPYRSYDGRCNNLIHPLWGSSHQPLVRFLEPDYEDGMVITLIKMTIMMSMTYHDNFDDDNGVDEEEDDNV